MANVRDQWYDSTRDPFGATTDAPVDRYHVQSTTKGGVFNNITVPSAANFPVVTPTRYFIEMPMDIDVSDLTGSYPFVLTDNTSSTTLSRVTGTPAANQYRVPPAASKRRATVEVHSGQAGHELSYDYYGNGSIPDAKEFNQINWQETVQKTNDYAITDTDRIATLQVSTSTTGDVIITLPTVADNKGREIYIYKDHDNGKVTVDGEGAETIGDNASEYLFSKWDFIRIQSDGTQWIIKSMYSSIDTGWVSRSDWTNVHIGTVALDYDSSSGTFTDGEVITGSTSSDSGIIHNSSSVTFDLRNVTNNGTCFTNNEIITGVISSATALVNEGSGTAKNLDSNFYHGTGLEGKEFTYKFYYNASASDTGSVELKNSVGSDGVTLFGQNLITIDSNNFKLQTSTGGLVEVVDAGTQNVISNEDSYYKIIWERKK